jgi:hypothetical protein
MPAELTVFTAPKPFEDAQIARIQRNALRSWRSLGRTVEVVLLGDEPGTQEAAVELGLRHLPQVERNIHGTPLVSDLFAQAARASDSPLLAYVNADILLLSDFLRACRVAAQQFHDFLLVGQRWDLEMREELAFRFGWEDQLRSDLRSRGALHSQAGSDFFVYPRACFSSVPPFAIGRAGWDNWMIYQARAQGWPVIDVTGEVQVVHQSHDYGHLPGGRIHYRLPESQENIRLGGGRRHIFTLRDADHRMQAGRVLRQPVSWGRIVRSVETFPTLRLGWRPLSELAFAVIHPVRAWREWRGRLAFRLGSEVPEAVEES